MFTVYVYALDTLADWELGYVIAELNSGRFFKKDAPASDIFSFHNNKILLSVAGRKLAGPYFLVRKEYSTLIFRK